MEADDLAPGLTSQPGHSEFVWPVRGSRVVASLLALTAAFLALSVLGQLLLRLQPDSAPLQSVMRATNVDIEGNLPSLFNALLLLAPALLLGLIARATAPARRVMRRGWGLLSLVFLYLSADEYLHLHELLMAPVRTALHVDGFLHYAWVVPYAALCAALLALLVPFLRRLPRRTLLAFVKAGALYLTGVMGLELVSGRLDVDLGVQNALVLPLTTLEEGLEMVGLSLFIGALLSYLRDDLPGVRLGVHFSPPVPGPADDRSA
ncbi:hypothetical protein CVO96_11150 [Deinococcus koreensis]|uniref:Uncharacterized protein n=1 Tax=Deinococcus koreensis TaxID=2054903 RepID=A0A2K3UZ85_9DEIO|nr:hypothetical protein CVO96_11150 [Deinococcus koreensis]